MCRCTADYKLDPRIREDDAAVAIRASRCARARMDIRVT